ncbi:MAG: hypothetical protein EX285_05195 [Thaumarchaeota archaeon]|nr:hypothetical protein [Nitrososphaerota archaeon]
MIRIALLQLLLEEDIGKLMDNVIKLLNYTEVVEADIICLPEQWHPKNVESFEEEFKDIINVAKEHDTTIIAGAFL